ncbi:MAG: hypothetical protein HWD92_00905 [Flavobacteriia bacterium]|nr:hypothetical protein [Flavobacteriia bacterium]
MLFLRLKRHISKRYSFLLDNGFEVDKSELSYALTWYRNGVPFSKGNLIIYIGQDQRESKVVIFKAIICDEQVEHTLSFSDFLKSITVAVPGEHDDFYYRSAKEIRPLLNEGARLLEVHLEEFELA